MVRDNLVILGVFYEEQQLETQEPPTSGFLGDHKKTSAAQRSWILERTMLNSRKTKQNSEVPS